MKKKVLFLCPGNSCQSQIAEGLLKHFYGSEYEVFSAGLNPIDINKNAIEVMKEIGIDISQNKTNHINDFLNQNFDIIITFCSNKEIKSSPFLSKALTYNWSLYNPAEGIETQKDLLKALRELRDNLKQKIIEHFKPY